MTLCTGLQATNRSLTSSLRKTTATRGEETRTDSSMGKELSSSVTEVTWRFVKKANANLKEKKRKGFCYGLGSP